LYPNESYGARYNETWESSLGKDGKVLVWTNQNYEHICTFVKKYMIRFSVFVYELPERIQIQQIQFKYSLQTWLRLAKKLNCFSITLAIVFAVDKLSRIFFRISKYGKDRSKIQVTILSMDGRTERAREAVACSNGGPIYASLH